MTEAKKHEVMVAYRKHKAAQLDLIDFEDNTEFAAYLAEQLRRLPSDSRLNAMIEIITILNRLIRVQGNNAQ